MFTFKVINVCTGRERGTKNYYLIQPDNVLSVYLQMAGLDERSPLGGVAEKGYSGKQKKRKKSGEQDSNE